MGNLDRLALYRGGGAASGPGQGECQSCIKGYSQKWEVGGKAGHDPGRGDGERRLIEAWSQGYASHS